MGLICNYSFTITKDISSVTSHTRKGKLASKQLTLARIIAISLQCYTTRSQNGSFSYQISWMSKHRTSCSSITKTGRWETWCHERWMTSADHAVNKNNVPFTYLLRHVIQQVSNNWHTKCSHRGLTLNCYVNIQVNNGSVEKNLLVILKQTFRLICMTIESGFGCHSENSETFSYICGKLTAFSLHLYTIYLAMNWKYYEG